MKEDLQNIKCKTNRTKSVGVAPLGDPLPKRNTQKGITLVALIITIIVLLILAMVSIQLIMNGGIIDRAERGTAAYTEEEIKEKIGTAYSEYQLAKYQTPITLEQALANSGLTGATADGSDTEGWEVFYNRKTYPILANGVVVNAKTTVKISAGETAPTDSNGEYKSNGKTAIIPSGYTVSNEEGETTIDTGLVIKKQGNEWVWIPVSENDFNEMFGTANDDGWTMSGTDVKTKYKSNGDLVSGKTRVNPGNTSGYREPDVLNNNNYDKKTTNLSTAELGENITEMATNLKNDYKSMMNSIKKYGGFYVGRYELSNAGTKKNQATLVNNNWYMLYAKCKTLGADSVEARMIWGCQWDQVCNFISTYGDKVSLSDSRTYGNFANSQTPANGGNYSSGSKKNTGSNEAWKTNNIYDFAGNCYEWTQEAYGTEYRAHRGSGFDSNGDTAPVTIRKIDVNPTYYGATLSSRPILYIK